MKLPLTLAVLASLLSVAALVSSRLGDRVGASQDKARGVLMRESSEASRLLELEAEVEELRRRLLERDLTPADVPAATGARTEAVDFATRAELEALREELMEAFAARPGPAPAPGQVDWGFKDRVESTLEQLERERQVEKLETWQAERLERLEETMPKIRDWLELTPSQGERMRSALLAQWEREAELTRRWQAGEDAGVLGEIKQEDRQAHRDELASFLTPAQLERYEERPDPGVK